MSLKAPYHAGLSPKLKQNGFPIAFYFCFSRKNFPVSIHIYDIFMSFLEER